MRISNFLSAIIFFLLVGLLACAPFRDSPYSDNLLRQERNLNLKALNQLGTLETDGKVRFAVITDSHQNYKPLDNVIYQINQAPNLDFIVHLGDFTNSSYNFEYDQFLDSFITLRPPSFCVPGNHDLIGAGIALYKKVFGAANFYFESPNIRFIFFNSANIEDPDGFDPVWLRDTVHSSTKPVVIFSHVELKDAERFSGTDADLMSQVISNSNTKLILNGHNHVYRLSDDGGTIMLQAPKVESGWLLVEIEVATGNVTIEGSAGESANVEFKP